MPAKKDRSVSPIDALISAALELAATKSWRDVTLIEIARTAGLPVADCYDHCRGKGDILRQFVRKIDREVLADLDDADFDEPGHDRLIAVIMARFDALAPYRPALRSILAAYGDLGPADYLRAIKTHFGSMRWMLEAAGFRTGGLHGSLRVAALTGIYVRCFKRWLEDDSPDFAPTMAFLDQELSRASRWDARVEKGLGKTGRFCGKISDNCRRFASKNNRTNEQDHDVGDPASRDEKPSAAH